MRLRREVAHQACRVIARAFEFLRVADRSGRASLRAKPAIHALADIDIEVGKLALLGFLDHFDADGDAGDRTVALASQAAGADVEVDFENAAITVRQSLLDRHRNLVGILDRHRPAHQMREGDRHPLEGRLHRVGDILYVAGNAHKSSSI